MSKHKGEFRGHCQACGRVQVILPSGMMAKHGYRVRSGYFSGTCSGSGKLPLEVSREFLDWIVTDLARFAYKNDLIAADLRSGLLTPKEAMKRSEPYGSIVYGERDARTFERSPVMVSWSDASAMEQAEQLKIDISEHEREASFARSHAKSLKELAARVHGQPVIDRDAEELARVAERKAKKAPIPGAFRTKAAQKDALDGLNRAYEKQRRVILDHYLAQPGRVRNDAGEEVYYAIPHDLHHWRAKFGTLVNLVYPQLAANVIEIERLYAERVAIKAMPVIK